jgi:hypothetical protein
MGGRGEGIVTMHICGKILKCSNFNETSQKPQSEVITALHHLQVEKTFFTTPTPNV